MRSLIKRKKGVVWVSTIIYTLIGLSVIALLLAVINPKIKEMKDSFVVKQSMVALGDFDDIVPNEIYCFDQVTNKEGDLSFPLSILLQMPDENTLLLERNSTTRCGSGPWNMTMYTTYTR